MSISSLHFMKSGLFAMLCIVIAEAGIVYGKSPSSMTASLPPTQYSLHDVIISVTTHSGHSARPRRTVTWMGQRSCRMLVEGDEQETADACQTVTTTMFVDLLNELYRIHFFELPSQYTTKYSVVLLEGDRLQLQGQKLSDTGSQVLCVKIGTYEKCITMVNDVPKELAELTQRVADFPKSLP